MTRTLSLAFWNVQNLFEVGGHDTRAPRSEGELSTKLDVLARVIQRLTDKGAPDILALAEVSSEAVLKRLVAKLGVQVMRPLLLFEPPTKKGDTGLALIAMSPRVSALTRVDAEQKGTRPKALSAKVSLATGGAPLNVVCCHWKSNLFQSGQMSPKADRGQSGRWLHGHMSSAQSPNGKLDPIVVFGDFNAEPYAPEISRDLYATRHLAKALRANTVRLYNCMWGWLVDPLASIAKGVPLNDGPRSPTSFDGGDHQILDQLLVSRSILRGEPFHLHRVAYHRDEETARITLQSRDIVPRSWDRDKRVGASDHFPLVVELGH